MGAGNGLSAHKIAYETGSNVTCINLCETQNASNKARIEELKLKDRVNVITLDMENLPLDWDNKFDVIWSIDGYYHVTDKPKLASECYRVLKPGGIMAFTDIMAGVTSTQESLFSFKRRFHLDKIYTQPMCEDILQKAGFLVRSTKDLTCHLISNYRRMLSRSSAENARLDKVSDNFLEEHRGFLQKDIETLTRTEAQAWVAFVGSKPIGEAADQGLMTSSFTDGRNLPTLMKRYVTCKLHNLVVSDKSILYHGSISICRKIMEAGGVEEYEAVDVVNLRNGTRWTTYVIAHAEEGTVTLNGGGARLGEVGVELVVMTYGLATRYIPAKVVYCGSPRTELLKCLAMNSELKLRCVGVFASNKVYTSSRLWPISRN